MQKGKKYIESAKLIDKTIQYSLTDAVELVKKVKFAKFDETVELALKMNLDSRKAEQNLRGALVLPNGTGKTQKVCVIAEGKKAEEAKKAGADVVGDNELIQQIAGGWLEFDVMVATPDMMPKLGRLGKVLGPRGLMPNPKTGTVTLDVEKAVHDIKNGKVEYRVDKFGNIQVPVGKSSFQTKALVENIAVVLDQIIKIKPATVKGTYLKNATISTTQGPGVKINPETR